MGTYLRTPAPSVPPDALIFDFPRGLRPLMLFGVGLFAVWILGAIVWLIDSPSKAQLTLLLLGIVFFAAMTMLALRVSTRLRDRVAVGTDGIWYLPRKAEPTFLPWGDVARVEAHDTAQRLVLVDARDGTEVRLEYQLKGFSKLRDFVLDHVPSAARHPATLPSVFHRTWINKGIFLGFLAILLFVARLAWSQGQPMPALIITILFVVPLFVAIARDPMLVMITPNGVVIKYPGWKQTIPFSAVSRIVLSDVRGNARQRDLGNTWAAVTIERNRGKPIRLFRFREGSIALQEALRSAWISAGGSDLGERR